MANAILSPAARPAAPVATNAPAREAHTAGAPTLGTESSADLRFSVIETAEDLDWDAFLERTPGGTYVQSSLWARSKARLGWRATRVIATRRDGAIVGGAQLLVRKLPVGGAVAFVYKGPVVADAAVVDPLLDQMHRVAQRLRIQYLTVQPPESGEGTVDRLLARSYRPGLVGWGHAPATTVIDLTQDSEQIVNRMRKTARNRLRRAQRMGVSVRDGTERDIELFHRLLVSTGQRKHIRTSSLQYFRHLWEIFAPSGHLKMFVAQLESEPLAAILTVCFGTTVSYWKAAWSGQHGDKEPNMLLQWRAIEWAKAHGYARYDFLGLESSHALSWALATGQVTLEQVGARPSFKLGFGGDIITSPIAYEYVPNPLVRQAYNFARDHALVWRLVNAAAQRTQGMAHRAG